MPIDASQLPSYSDSDLLIIYRWALANGAAGTTRSIQGRSITFPTVREMRDMIVWLEQRIADDAGSQSGMSGNTSVVQFDGPA